MRRALLVLLSVAGFVLAAAVPAGAETRELTEKTTVSPARGDITALKAVNGDKRLVGVVHLRKAVRGDATVGLLIRARGGPVYGAWTMATKRGGQKKAVFVSSGDDLTQVRCRGLRVRIKERRDLVRISVPHRCLGDVRRPLRVSALTEYRGGGGDIDMTRWLRVPRG